MKGDAMTYRAPVNEMLFMMRHVGELERAIDEGIYPDLSIDDVKSILQEAARFSGDVLAPINRPGDRHGAQLRDGVVTTAPGFKEAYQSWVGAGWNALAGPAEYGGQGLPLLLNAGCSEMWNGACLAFGVAPLLTFGGVEALAAHGSEDLKQRYLEKLVGGEWTATMNLTEPQAGSDLSAIRTRAEPCDDGSYRISGQKIFISYGEHDLTDNIVHLVLARLPNAPKGTRGISLFLVPKVLPDGSRNDVRCSSLEHKLGIHASPTCTMVYGDNGGARGWLLGEEHRGLACMFTMMNSARLSVALQGVAIAELACQDAVAFAGERRQGASPSHNGNGMAPIIEHADVRRMLATMRGLTNAARAVSYATAQAIDRSHRSQDSAERESASERAALLTPVAKAFATDIAIEVASLGIQVHGGMGFIEETGAAQHLRDARILSIYEGTNGIQAIDLVTRKLPMSGGEAVRRQIGAMRAIAGRLADADCPTLQAAAPQIAKAIKSLERATMFMLDALAGNSGEAALAGATPYLRLFATAHGGALLGASALAAHRAASAGDNDPANAGRVQVARFFADNIAPSAPGLADVVIGGAASLKEAQRMLAD
jgi:3-(methylsulfanyl)propanoyl-CoA dehydrogenase